VLLYSIFCEQLFYRLYSLQLNSIDMFSCTTAHKLLWWCLLRCSAAGFLKLLLCTRIITSRDSIFQIHAIGCKRSVVIGQWHRTIRCYLGNWQNVQTEVQLDYGECQLHIWLEILRCLCKWTPVKEYWRAVEQQGQQWNCDSWCTVRSGLEIFIIQINDSFSNF